MGLKASHETPTIGLYGGSFDPIHVGHLALARSAISALKLTELRWIPSGHSWQKPGQRTPGDHRLAMLQLATDTQDPWHIDTIEIERDGPSYTIDTLEALRNNLGPLASLVLLMGSDQLHNLPTWHRYKELTDYANIAVTQRERIGLSNFAPEVQALLDEFGSDSLQGMPSGSIVFFRMPAVPVSSTKLRGALARQEPVNDLLPQTVLDYIRVHNLYNAN